MENAKVVKEEMKRGLAHHRPLWQRSPLRRSYAETSRTGSPHSLREDKFLSVCKDCGKEGAWDRRMQGGETLP